MKRGKLRELINENSFYKAVFSEMGVPHSTYTLDPFIGIVNFRLVSWKVGDKMLLL